MWYLKSAYEAYQTVQSKLQSGLTGMQSAAMSPLTMMKSFLQGQITENRSPETRTENTVELQQLRERIAELEARIAKPKRAPTAAKRKSTKK